MPIPMFAGIVIAILLISLIHSITLFFIAWWVTRRKHSYWRVAIAGTTSWLIAFMIALGTGELRFPFATLVGVIVIFLAQVLLLTQVLKIDGGHALIINFLCSLLLAIFYVFFFVLFILQVR